MSYRINVIPSEKCIECSLFTEQKCQISTLPAETIQQLENRKKVYAFKKHTMVFEKDNPCIGIYFIKKGKVKIFRIGKSGREQIVRLETTGDVVGYRAFFSEKQIYSASAFTMEDTQLCFFSKEIFYPVVTLKNTFVVNIIKKITKDLEMAEEQIINISQEYVSERIIHAIIKLLQVFGYKEDKKTINIRITKSEIAGLAGTTNETTIRVISQLQKDKIIEVKNKEIKIIKLNDLLRLARK